MHLDTAVTLTVLCVALGIPKEIKCAPDIRELIVQWERRMEWHCKVVTDSLVCGPKENGFTLSSTHSGCRITGKACDSSKPQFPHL